MCKKERKSVANAEDHFLLILYMCIKVYINVALFFRSTNPESNSLPGAFFNADLGAFTNLHRHFHYINLKHSVMDYFDRLSERLCNSIWLLKFYGSLENG